MKRFYKNILIEKEDANKKEIALKYDGEVFSGIQFKDSEGQIMKSRNETFKSDNQRRFTTVKNETSDVCGTQTTNTSGWMPFGGPIKGSYIV